LGDRVDRTLSSYLDNQINIDTFCKYYSVVALLYENQNFSDALKGFRRLIEFHKGFYTYFIPYLSMCEYLEKTPISENDVKSTGFIDKISYLKKHAKIAFKKNIIRCKYCGQYTDFKLDEFHHTILEYKESRHTIPAFAFSDLCLNCGSNQPELSIRWDSWEALEEGIHLFGTKHKEKLAETNNILKSRYPDDFIFWSTFRKKSHIYKPFFPSRLVNWIKYQQQILRFLLDEAYFQDGHN